MPNLDIQIGGRHFEVACQEGEEQYLTMAAAMLDGEASALVAQIGNLTESKLLLMSGLMLADKMAGLKDQLAIAERRALDAANEIEQIKQQEPKSIEVPVIPQSVTDSLAEIAARAESLADKVEAK